MDESGARLVHGGARRQRDLEAVVYRDRAWRSFFWRVQSTLFYRRRGWLYWIITAAVGYSRIYLGAHWPSDIIATLFLAVGEALLMLGLFELIWRTGARKWAPNLYAQHPGLILGHVSNLPGKDWFHDRVKSLRHEK